MLSFLNPLGAYVKIGLVVAGIVALSVLYVMVRKSGADAARIKGALDQLANVKKAQDAEIAVHRADAAERARLRKKWTAPVILLCLLLGACSGIDGASLPKTGCEWNKFIVIHDGDVVPDSRTETQIFAYNEARERVCGPLSGR